MSSSTEGGAIDTVRTVRASLNEDLMVRLEDKVLGWIDERCKAQINGGDYDVTVALTTLYTEEFVPTYHPEHVDSSPIERAVPFETVIDATDSSAISDGWDTVVHLVFQQVIDALEARNAILYVYDRQRVRSRVAEIARYFALIRQRRSEDIPYEFSPNLVKMVKMDVLDRKSPKWGAEGEDITHYLQEILELLQDTTAAPEFSQAYDSPEDWLDDTEAALKTLRTLARDEGIDQLAKYQGRSLRRMFVQAVSSSDVKTEGTVVTASTGGGKTEAFILPILAYCLTANRAGIDGRRAVIGYPRTDLCENQFQRFIGYIYKLNKLLGVSGTSFEEAPITIGLQYGNPVKAEFDCPIDGCQGTVEAEQYDDNDKNYDTADYYACQHDTAHRFEFSTGNKDQAADILITTPDSLHRRLMDGKGRNALWGEGRPPKFVGLDEVHVYSAQYGMHVANVMRRLQQGIRTQDNGATPVPFAASATISNAEEFTQKIFGINEAVEITPREYADKPDRETEVKTEGREYVVFVKSTDPRTVELPEGDATFKPRQEWTEDETVETTASNLSCMIQIAFGFYHVLDKEYDPVNPKNKVLGFVDSIDSVGRLGEYLMNAEQDDELFRFRTPDARLAENLSDNPDCPTDRFQSNTHVDDERAVCDSLPPNKHLTECPVYEAGECWWTMKDDLLTPMDIGIHRSGKSQQPDGEYLDEWDIMISTSALEVGFDHPGIIGTFQYRAPMSIPGYVQRRGRGGRDPGDTPVSVVVLGSSPDDSFYFHNEQQLSRPDDEHLQIPLDEQNRFVKMEHMVSAVFDYINLTEDPETADEIYNVNIRKAITIIKGQRDSIADYLSEAFPKTNQQDIDQALDKLIEYLTTTQNETAPKVEPTPFWQMLQANVYSKAINRDKLTPIRNALEKYPITEEDKSELDKIADKYFGESEDNS